MNERDLFELVRRNYGESNKEYLKAQMRSAINNMQLPLDETVDVLLDWALVAGFCGLNDHYRPYFISAISHLLRMQDAHLIAQADFDKADENGLIPVWVEYYTKNGETKQHDGWKLISLNEMLFYQRARFWNTRPSQKLSADTPWSVDCGTTWQLEKKGERIYDGQGVDKMVTGQPCGGQRDFD